MVVDMIYGWILVYFGFFFPVLFLISSLDKDEITGTTVIESIHQHRSRSEEESDNESQARTETDQHDLDVLVYSHDELYFIIVLSLTS